MASRLSAICWNIGYESDGIRSEYSRTYRPFFASKFTSISCKIRPRNLSAHSRKQQSKKFPTTSPPLDMSYKPIKDESQISDIEKAEIDSVSDAHQQTKSDGSVDSDAVTEASNGTDFVNLNVTAESNSLSDIRGEQISTVQLEDLKSMIKNAEKNVLLLNEARVHALEDLDKILSEKEVLQREINSLETRLAEADARIKGAANEKINVEVLESQLEKLKIELYERDQGNNSNLCGNDEKNLNVESSSSDAVNLSSLAKELDVVRKENMELKDGIQSLEMKFDNVKGTDERVLLLEKERLSLEATLKHMESRLKVAQDEVTELKALKFESKSQQEKVENLQLLLIKASEQFDQAILELQQNRELWKKFNSLDESLEKNYPNYNPSESIEQFLDTVQQKMLLLEERLQNSDEEIHSQVKLYHESVKEFQDTIQMFKEESKRREKDEPVEDMPWDFWSRLLIMFDGWLLEKKISFDEASTLRDMTWKRSARIYDAYVACKDKGEREVLATFLKLISASTRLGLHVIHIAAEMAPVAKVGGLGDVVSGLGKALQKKGHLVEIILPKYDCMQYDRISDLKVLDVVVQSYFDGQLFSNKIWVGTVEGIPVYFIEPLHPAKFFWRGQFYGEHDDFKRFSFFSRAALELILQSCKKPDIIHCHDWQTAFVAPLYWDIYAPRGLNSARICFTCHNFEYQGTSPASELSSIGLDVRQLNRPDRMQDIMFHDRVNPVKGAIVFSNIVTTVSPTYAEEVRTVEGGRGLHATLNSHSRKFVGILNGIDTDTWNPSTDNFLRFQYTAEDLHGKTENKDFLRKQLKLSSNASNQPLVGCITRLVPQKGVHLIRHAIYRTLELGGQFVLLGSSPVPHIQREFEGIARHFENSPHVRLILKYDDVLSHSIYAASDMFIIPSLFEPCGLTQMIAMRYGSVPIVRKTGGLNDSVFDMDNETIPPELRNGFTFWNPDEQAVNNALERAFHLYKKNPKSWQQLVERNMKIDFSWDSSAARYEELYEKSVARARAAAAPSLSRP